MTIRDPKVLLGKILQILEDRGYAQVRGYFRFEFVEEGKTWVSMKRRKGTSARIPLMKILEGIKFYQRNNDSYDEGPVALRRAGLTHITSPIFALLHLLPEEAYFSS